MALDDTEKLSFLKPLKEKEYEYISNLVYHYCGINLHDGKKELIRTRLCRRLRELQMESFEEYCEYLRTRKDVSEINTLIDILSTNTTSFYRESTHFSYLERELPEIIKDNKESGKNRLRLWSTASSSGEEPYTLAIVVAEMLEKFPGVDAKILATDISTEMLERAARGTYDSIKVKPVPPHLKIKYFQGNGDTYTVCDSLRRLVKFRHLNVVGPWPFKGPFDIIFCRNMMIYFDKKTQIELVSRFSEYLTPGGYLFVGHSESLVGLHQCFKYVLPSIYRNNR